MPKLQMTNFIKKFSLCSIILVLMCSSVGFLWSSHWFFDLFNNFRPQAVVAAIVLLLVSILIKDRSVFIVSSFVLLLNLSFIFFKLNLFPVSQGNSSNLYEQENHQEFSIVFSNVLSSNNNYSIFLDTVSNHDPDILVIAEVNEPWMIALEKIQSIYLYRHVMARTDNFGMAILSKKPFKEATVYDVGNYQIPLVRVDFDSFVLLAAHPIPPLSNQNTGELHAYLQKIAKLVREIDKPLVIAGDFNSTLWSSSFNHLAGLGLNRTNPLGLAWTWPQGFLPLAVQIDHIFVKGVSKASFEVLPNIGSDHFPVKSKILLFGTP